MKYTEEELENSNLCEFTKHFAMAALSKLNKLDGKPEVSKAFKIVGALGGMGATVVAKLPIRSIVSKIVKEGALFRAKIKQKNDKIQLISTIDSTSSKHSRQKFLQCVTRLGVSVYNEYKNSIVYVNQQSLIVEKGNEGPKPDKAGTTSAAIGRKENKNQAMHALGKCAGEIVFSKMLKLGIESPETIISALTGKSIMNQLGAECDSIGTLKLFYWSQKPGQKLKEKTFTPYEYFVKRILDDPVKSGVAIRTRHGDNELTDTTHQSLIDEKYDLILVADAIYEMIVRDPSFDWEMSVTQSLCEISQNVKSAGIETHENNILLTELKEIALDIRAQVVKSGDKSKSKLDPIWFPVDAFQQQTVCGREKVVADLHENIESNQGTNRFVIFGIGGIGKTTVVRKYIAQYHKNYHHFIWIHAQNVTAAQNQFRLLAAKKLRIQKESVPNSPQDFLELREEIYRKLCNNQARLLLVLDNAEAVSLNDPDITNEVVSLKSLLPPSIPGYNITVLITSRESNWNDDVFHSIRLGHWTDEECIDFVLKKLKLPATIENKATALALATHFDRLTISMQSAVSIIREEKNKQHHEGIVSYGIQDLINDYDRGAQGRLLEIQLWNISFKKILKRNNGKLAIKIICFMAYLSPDAIPKHFLRALFQDTNNGDCLTDAFVLLTSYSLIHIFDMHYTIHRRIQEAVIQNFKLQSTCEEFKIFTDDTFENEITVLRNLSKQLHAYLGQMTTKQKLAEEKFDVIANCLHVTSFFSKSLNSFPDCREFMVAVADIMDDSNNCNKAIELYKTVIDSINPATDQNSEQTLQIQDKLCSVLDRQKRFKNTLEIHKVMLKIKLEVFGTHHPSTLETQGNYINTLLQLKRHHDASEMFNKFQEDIKNMTHLEHPSASIAKLNFAGLLYKHSKDYAAALDMFQNVLQELCQSPKPDHKSILGVQGWIANTLGKLGRHGDSTELRSQILSKSIKEFGPTSKLTLASRKRYAYALQEQGNFKKALEVWQDVLKYEESLEKSHHVDLNMSVTKLNVAQSHIELREFEKAIEILESLVEFYRDEHGTNHPLTLTTMNSLGFALKGNGKYEDSLELYEQVLEGRIKSLGVCHTDTLTTKHNIGWAFLDKGDFEKANLIACEILSTRDKSAAGKHKFDYSDTETLLRYALHGLGPTKKNRIPAP